MKQLQEIWHELAEDGYETDKGSIHSYIEVYEDVLAPYRDTATNVLEIGLFNGHSMRMWERYFTKAKVHGIDCDEQPHGGLADLRPMIAEGGHNIYIMDALSPNRIFEHFSEIQFDVIIEDAGHDESQQVAMYLTYKHLLSKGGIYIIEDIQDIDRSIGVFKWLDPDKSIEILDRREQKGRYDDVLIIFKDK